MDNYLKPPFESPHLDFQSQKKIATQKIANRFAFLNRKFQICCSFCLRSSKDKMKVPKLPEKITAFFKFRRVTIWGAQPSVRLSEEICLSKGFLEAFAGGSLRGFCGVPAGLCGGPQHFPRIVTLSLWPGGAAGILLGRDFESQRVRAFEFAAFSGRSDLVGGGGA